MNLNFISRISASENRITIWIVLIVGFFLSIYHILDLFLSFSYWVVFGLIRFSTIVFVLWSMLPYVVFAGIAPDIKGRGLLIIIGLAILLIDIYFLYALYASTSVVGIGFIEAFSPIILTVLIFVVLRIGRFLKLDQ